MADSNLSTSISAIRTKILNDAPTATVDELVSLARAAKSIGLTEDTSIETAINSRANTLSSNASTNDMVKLSNAIKQLRNTTAGAVSPSTTSDDIVEGTSNLYYTDAKVQTKLGDVSGHIIPDTNEVYDLGSAEKKFRHLYLSGNTLTLGSVNISDNNGSLEVTPVSGGGSAEAFATEAYVTTQVNNLATVATSGNYNDLTNKPTIPSISGLATETYVQNYVSNGGVVTVYDTANDLPLSDNTAGDQAFVSETNRLYLWTGTGWYNIALINTTPSITQTGDAEYNFLTDGTPIVVTLQATDPEEVPIQWSYQITSGSATNLATIQQNDNIFTFTPTTNPNFSGEFTVTFTASDGVNIDTTSSQFSISFSAPPSGALFTTTGTQTWTVPQGVFEINVVAIGAGGGGGDGHTYSDKAGQGGCAGGLAYLNNVSVNPGDTLEISVGAGTSAVGYNQVANTGGASYVKRTQVSGGGTVDELIVMANGGQGGRTINRYANSGNGTTSLYVVALSGGSATSYSGNWSGSTGGSFTGGGISVTNPVGPHSYTQWRETGGGSTADYDAVGADCTFLAGGSENGNGTGVYGDNLGNYGYGGKGGHYNYSPENGANGAVRIMWGDANTTRAFPTPNADAASSTDSEATY